MFTSNEIAAGGYLPPAPFGNGTTLRRRAYTAGSATRRFGFPHPIYIGQFRYWKIADLLAWEASRPSVGAPAGAARQRASSGQ